MTCDRCPHMKRIKDALRPCQSCDEAHVRNRVQLSDYTVAQRRLDDHAPTSGVTTLPPDVEDTLRKAMSTLFGLDPVDFLLVQHIFKGGSLGSFGEKLRELHRKIHFYNPSSTRSMAHAKKDAIARVMPQLAPVFDAMTHNRPQGDE